MRFVLALALLIGCGEEPSVVEWYGRCAFPVETVTFEILDVEPAPTGASLLESTGTWALSEGSARVTRMAGTARGDALVATCQGEVDPMMPRATRCTSHDDPYFATQTLFDLDFGAAGRLIVKGEPGDIYTGPGTYLGATGSCEVSRAPLPPPDEPECEANEVLCDDVCTDPSSDATSCGVCGHACEGECVLGVCEEHRERQRAFAFGRERTCLLAAGDVLCFDATGVQPATRAWAEGDAVEAAVYDGFLCVVRATGDVECIELASPSNPLITAPSGWTDVISIASNGASLAAVTSTGQLRWQTGIGFDVDPLDGVGLVWGTSADNGPLCWREVGGRFVCKNLSLEDPVAGPSIDAVYHGRIGAYAIDVDGEVRRWPGGAGMPSTPLDFGGALQLSAGNDHLCALVEGGQVHCWSASAIDDPAYLGMAVVGATAIASEGATACAKLVDESVTCWLGQDPFETVEVDLSVEGT